MSGDKLCLDRVLFPDLDNAFAVTVTRTMSTFS